MKIAIVQLEDLVIASFYDSPVPNQSLYGGPWGWPTHTIHLAVPETMDYEVVRVTRLPPDPSKEQDQPQSQPQPQQQPQPTEYVFEIDPVKVQKKFFQVA